EAKVLPAIGTWVTDGDTKTQNELREHADTQHAKFALDLGHIVNNIKKKLTAAGGMGKGFKSLPVRVAATIMRMFKRVAVFQPEDQRPNLLRLLLSQVVLHYTNTASGCDRACFCNEKRRK